MAYRFESGHRHQNMGYPTGVSHIFIAETVTRTHPNARLRWSLACHRLDGDNTIRGAAEAIESRERGERCRWQIKRPERVAAVGVQRSRSVGKAHTGYRNRTPAPRRSKLCIACSDFFQKSERTHAVAPPFQPRPACAGLASDNENGSDLNCLTAPNKYNPNHIFRIGNGFGLFVYTREPLAQLLSRRT